MPLLVLFTVLGTHRGFEGTLGTTSIAGGRIRDSRNHPAEVLKKLF